MVRLIARRYSQIRKVRERGYECQDGTAMTGSRIRRMHLRLFARVFIWQGVDLPRFGKIPLGV
jgi:hypothetical protein